MLKKNVIVTDFGYCKTGFKPVLQLKFRPAAHFSTPFQHSGYCKTGFKPVLLLKFRLAAHFSTPDIVKRVSNPFYC